MIIKLRMKSLDAVEGNVAKITFEGIYHIPSNAKNQ